MLAANNILSETQSILQGTAIVGGTVALKLERRMVTLCLISNPFREAWLLSIHILQMFQQLRKTVMGMNGASITVPVFYVVVRDVTYADGKLEEDLNDPESKTEGDQSTAEAPPFDEEDTDKSMEENVTVPDEFPLEQKDEEPSADSGKTEAVDVDDRKMEAGADIPGSGIGVPANVTKSA